MLLDMVKKNYSDDKAYYIFNEYEALKVRTFNITRGII